MRVRLDKVQSEQYLVVMELSSTVSNRQIDLSLILDQGTL